MAYRFNGTTDFVRFDISPFTGYVFGAGTIACFVKRTTVSTLDSLVAISTLTPTDRLLLYTNASNNPVVFRGASKTGTPVLSSTSTWYLIVATFAAGTVTPRVHVHDGTSWTHTNASGTMSDLTAIVGTDQLLVGKTTSAGFFLVGDVVCVGIKKSDSADATVETLTPTAFQTWRNFSFDWLIGFDSSLEAAGILQDQASPGTGDEAAISGTSAVSDPAGWSWVSASTISGSATVSLTDTVTTAGTRVGVTVNGSATVTQTVTITSRSAAFTFHASSTVSETVTVTTRGSLPRMTLAPAVLSSLTLTPSVAGSLVLIPRPTDSLVLAPR